MSSPLPPAAFFVAEHRVRGFEGGPAGNLKFINCLHYLQEASETQAEQIGVGLSFVKERGFLWVLAGYHIRLHRYPLVGETVRVATWPYGWKRLFALREFVFLDAHDQRYGEATSAWLLVREGSFRPVRPQEHLPAIPLHNRREIEDPFAPLPAPGNDAVSRSFEVRAHDLDVNRHVNNAVYVEWALESVPPATWSDLRPFEVEARFLSMAFFGDTVLADTQVPAPPGNQFLHRIRRASDKRELTRLRSRWQPLP